MDKRHFIELLHKYHKGETTEEENEFLYSYYNLFESEPGIESLLEKNKSQQIGQEIHEQIWKQIDAEERRSSPVISARTFLKYAAAVILIVSTSLYYFTHRSYLTADKQVTIFNQQRESQLVHLPDGSTVILNVGSRLDFPATFAATANREVYLEGEAYFDISHNEKQRFIVHAGKLETTVLGTAFNIKAIPGENDITVTVTRGKVKISNKNKILGLITKGQEIIYNKNAGQSVQQSVPKETQLNWKLRDIFFDDVTVEDAAKLLEERFDLRIVFEDPEIKAKRFTTVFLQREGLDEVLKSICEFNDATYQYDTKKAPSSLVKNNTSIN